MRKERHAPGAGRGSRTGVWVSTGLNEVLEDPSELRVLVDVEEVGERLQHLPLLEEKCRGPPSAGRASTLKRAAFLSCPLLIKAIRPCILSSHLVKQTEGREAKWGWGLP